MDRTTSTDKHCYWKCLPEVWYTVTRNVYQKYDTPFSILDPGTGEIWEKLEWNISQMPQILEIAFQTWRPFLAQFANARKCIRPETTPHLSLKMTKHQKIPSFYPKILGRSVVQVVLILISNAAHPIHTSCVKPNFLCWVAYTYKRKDPHHMLYLAFSENSPCPFPPSPDLF